MNPDNIERTIYRLHNHPEIMELADGFREMLARLKLAEKVIEYYCDRDDSGVKAREYFQLKMEEDVRNYRSRT